MGLPLHLPHRTGAHPHHPGRTPARFAKFEGMTDIAVVAGVILLAGAIVYGLLTTTGNSPWY